MHHNAHKKQNKNAQLNEISIGLMIWKKVFKKCIQLNEKNVPSTDVRSEVTNNAVRSNLEDEQKLLKNHDHCNLRAYT